MNDQPENFPGDNKKLRIMAERADETARRIYVAQFWDLAVAFLLREHIAEHGPEKVETLIESWRQSVGKVIGNAIKSDLDEALDQAGLVSESEVHDRADRLMYEAESLIRHTINRPKNDLGN